MATTINAATTGLIETSDGTAVLDLQTGGTTAIRVNATQAIGVGSSPSFGTAGQFLTSQGSAASPTWTSGGSGTVTSVSWTGGIVSVATATTTPAFTIAGTSGGIPYFSSASTWASSAALTANGVVYGGGAGAAPAATAAGTTGQFLGANTGAAPTWQTPAGGSPGGSTTQVQYNSSGSFAGSANMTFDGTSLTAGAFIPSSSTAPANGMYLQSANTVTIASNSTAKFTATATDAVLNGTSLPNVNGNPTVFSMSMGANGWYASSSATNNYWNHSVNGTVYNLRYQGSTVGNITINSTNVAFVTTSDYRFKENIKPIEGALARVALLKPCTYTWKSNGEAAEGFIAHELQEVIPQAVSGVKDALDEEGKIKPQGVDTSFLVATLTAAIQELTARVAALEAK